MSNAVPEIGPEAGVLDDRACGQIDVAVAGAGTNRLNRRGLGFLDDFVNLLHATGQSTDAEHARQVAAITAGFGSEIDQNRPVATNSGRSGAVVGLGRIGPDRHDGGEARAVGGHVTHVAFKESGGRTFGHAHAQITEGFFQGTLLGGNGLANPADFRVVFDRSQFKKPVVRFDDLRNSGFSTQLPFLPHAQVLGLDADAAEAPDQRNQRLVHRYGANRGPQVRTVVLDRAFETAVGDGHDRTSCDQQPTVVGIKSAQVVLIGRMGDEHPLQIALLHLLAQLLQAAGVSFGTRFCC